MEELLELVGLSDAADRVVSGYSGGMKRRLDVALGLVHRPPVLFLDEPTTGLDPEARVALWAGARQTRAACETLTILLTTHYLEEADALADRLAIVSRGKVVVEGTPEALKQTLRGEAVIGRADRTARGPRGGRGRARDRGRLRGDDRGPCAAHARRERRARDPGDPLGARCRGHRRRRRSPRTGRRSTTSTSTTPAASSRRTRRPHGDRRCAHVVHDRPPDPQPDARADLDRAAPDPAAGLADPLRAAVQARRRTSAASGRRRTSRSSRRRS